MSTENEVFLHLSVNALEGMRGLLKQTEAENKALKGFARAVIQGMWDGGVDGSNIQDLAVKHGLIEGSE